MKYTTKRQDAEFLARMAAQVHATRKVGDAVLSCDQRTETTIVRIDGDIAVLANGDELHISRVRSVGFVR